MTRSTQHAHNTHSLFSKPASPCPLACQPAQDRPLQQPRDDFQLLVAGHIATALRWHGASAQAEANMLDLGALITKPVGALLALLREPGAPWGTEGGEAMEADIRAALRNSGERHTLSHLPASQPVLWNHF